MPDFKVEWRHTNKPVKDPDEGILDEKTGTLDMSGVKPSEQEDTTLSTIVEGALDEAGAIATATRRLGADLAPFKSPPTVTEL